MITPWKQPLTYLAQSTGKMLFPLVDSAVDSSIKIFRPGEWNQRRWDKALAEANNDAKVTELARLAANPRGAWRQASMGDVGSNESVRSERERITTIWESRECMNNFGFMKMLAWKYALYVVGRLHYQPMTSDSGLNAIYQDYIAEWFLKENCDITGRFNFRKLMELAYMGYKIDGDSGIIPTLREGDIRLQMIQGDRIGNPTDYSYTEGYYSGVITDEVGKPVGYKIYKRTRNNVYLDPVVVNALNFCHVINPRDMDMYRGWSVNDTAIAPARQVFNIIQNELRAVNALSGQTALVGTKGNEAGAKWMQEQRALAQEAMANKKPMPTMPSQEIKPGTINYIADGDSITAFTYNRPSPAFQGLMDFEFKEICDAWSADANFFMGGGAKGANIRLGSSQMKRVFQAEQQVMEDQALGPLIDLKLQFGMATGAIPAHPEWRKKEFTYGACATSDNGDDGQLEIDQIKMGMLPLDEWLKRHDMSNGQIDQHVSRLGEAAQRILAEAKSANAPVYMIQMRTPNGDDPGAEDDQDDDTGGGDGDDKPEGGGGESELAELRARVKELETELSDDHRDERGRFAPGKTAHAQAKRIGKKIDKVHGLIKQARKFVGGTAGNSHRGRAGNFVVKDPHAKSVRVYFDPHEKGPRQRRTKYFYERVSFKRKMRDALIAAGVVTAGLAAEAYRRGKDARVPNFKSGGGQLPPAAGDVATLPNVHKPIEPDMPGNAPRLEEPGTVKVPRKKAGGADDLYSKTPRKRNRVDSNQRVKFRKKDGSGGSGLSLESGDKPEKV